MPTQTRLPRFKPQYAKRPLELDERDIAILKTVHDFRVINSKHLKALFQHTVASPPPGVSKHWQREIKNTGETIIRRLGELFHHGFLDRPRSQLNLGNIPMIYALGARGAKALRDNGFDFAEFNAVRWRKNEHVAYRLLNHQLMVTDFIVALRLALRNHPTVKFLGWDREHELKAVRVPIEIPAGSHRKQKTLRTNVTVRPDAIFRIQFLDKPEGQNTANFFLEADTGAMAHPEFYKKVHAYWQLHLNKGHVEHFDVSEFRVLTTTSSLERAHNMRDFISKKWAKMRTPPTSNHRNRFLFTASTEYSVEDPNAILSEILFKMDDEYPRSILPKVYMQES